MGGRYKAARRKREDTKRRPSLFFLIALSIGVAILAWAAIYAIRHPEKPVPPTSPVTKTAIVYLVGSAQCLVPGAWWLVVDLTPDARNCS